MDFETVMVELIANAGEARSRAIEAIRKARKGDLEEAEKLLQQSSENLIHTHELQTDLLRADIEGSPIPLNLLMVHAQDHVMNAMTVKDLAKEMVAMMKERTV